jgi:hypothetical protein
VWIVFPRRLGAAVGTFYRKRHTYESSALAGNISSIASFFSISPWSRE